jgi:hypothetical protein
LSCEKTFEGYGSTRPIPCTAGAKVTLKDNNGNSLTKTSSITTDEKIGVWTIESSCEILGSPGVNGLSIYATQPGKKDPLTKADLNKSHPIAALFSPELRLCQSYFDSAPPRHLV